MRYLRCEQTGRDTHTRTNEKKPVNILHKNVRVKIDTNLIEEYYIESQSHHHHHSVSTIQRDSDEKRK